ncbi:MAG: methyltransferase domain-containing protein [Myxococcales bacterium]|nr:methyltransferase domain-containing protein [Myxococcales bacterium]MCB9524812.1 methyltransferase domain-containing protein [Myxococcales bacterium]
MKDNRSYYDDFAGWYERERHHGYHAMLDRLQVGIARPLSVGKDVLELGCGTGLILKEIDPFARKAVGLDISRGMLEQARGRGLNVMAGSATDLPFADGSFDFVYSFKVLAHVQAIEQAMREVHRVLRPGGKAALEFYNKTSLRYLIKKFKRPNKVSDQTNDHEVYTRYDSLSEVRRYLPNGLKVVDVRGVRVFTPFAQAHKVPGVAQVLGTAERIARDRAVTARLGGFLVVIVEKA